MTSSFRPSGTRLFSDGDGEFLLRQVYHRFQRLYLQLRRRQLAAQRFQLQAQLFVT
ncbi:MAG: hypothetical protein ABIQ93_17260 [Saprospiraceae bacterium]